MTTHPLNKIYARSSEKKRIAGLVGTGYITELAASIEKMGVVNPLTVVLPSKDSKWRRVISGAARLEALKTLLRQGKISSTYQVPIHVVPEMTEDQIRSHRAHETPGYAHLLAADRLFPYQRKLVDEALKRKHTFFAVSTPSRQEGKTLAYFDFENQGLKLNNGDTLKVTYQIHDEVAVDYSGVELRLAKAYADQGFGLHNYYQQLGRSWRVGHGLTTALQPDWIDLDTDLMVRHSAKPTKDRSFDLGSHW